MEEKLYLLAAELCQLLARCMTAITQAVASKELWPSSCLRALLGPWHPTKCLMVALCSPKGHIALCRGLHNCHVSEGKAMAEAMTLPAGKAEGCGKCQEKYLPCWM